MMRSIFGLQWRRSLREMSMPKSHSRREYQIESLFSKSRLPFVSRNSLTFFAPPRLSAATRQVETGRKGNFSAVNHTKTLKRNFEASTRHFPFTTTIAIIPRPVMHTQRGEFQREVEAASDFLTIPISHPKTEMEWPEDLSAFMRFDKSILTSTKS